MRRAPNRARRWAASTVEFAFVCPVVLGLLFSILEYSRYLMTRHLAEDAAREGARFAVARTDTLQTNVNNTTITNVVKDYLATGNNNLSGMTVQIYKSNQAGQPLDANDALVGSIASAAAFDQTNFGDYITVTLAGNFEPVLPSFLMLAPSLPITASAVMCSEGN